MRANRIGILAFFVALDASAALSSSQPFTFYDVNGNKVGTGGAYTTSSSLATGTSSVRTASATTTLAAAAVADVALPGTMPGSASVSPSGVAGYSIPISLPRSLAGFGPALSVDYSSQAQSGLLGIGWNVSGLQQITRCPQTRAQDGALKGVSLSATDRFCLGGQRLVKVSGTAYGADGAEYRTEIDSFSKIISYGTVGTGPQSFKVWTKDGQIMEFGNTTDSRLPVNATDTAGTATSQATVQAWSLNRVSDRKKNYWTVSYSHEVGSGMLYPTRIDYAGNSASTMSPVAPANSVRFEYEARPASDTSLQFLASSRIISNKRLKALRTYAGATQAAEYRFAYEANDAGGRIYNQTRLASLTECHFKAAVSYCLEPTSLEWTSDASYNFPDVTSTKRSASLAGLSPAAYTNMVGDINGDGRADIVFANVTSGVLRVRSMLANAGVAASDFGAAVVSQPTGTYTVDTPSFALADINMDGKADLILGSIGSSGFKVYALLANGDGTFASATPTVIGTGNLSTDHRFMVTDVNSDGIPDYVAFYTVQNSATVRVALRTASGALGSEQVSSFYLSAWSGQTVKSQVIADVDGDGVPDALIAVRLSNNDYATYIAKGDGAGKFSTTPVAVVSASATAIANATGASIKQSAGYDPSGYRVDFQDVNRDGLMDLVLSEVVRADYCQGSACDMKPQDQQEVLDQCQVEGCVLVFQGVHVALAKGNAGFVLKGGFSTASAGVASSTLTEWMPTYGDVDGNGSMDVIRVGLDGNKKPWLLLSFGLGNGDFYWPFGGKAGNGPVVATAGLSYWGTLAVQNDVNVDGIPDIIIPFVYKNAADGEAISAHVTRIVKDKTITPQQQHLLSRIKQGTHIVNEFDYQTLPSASSLYLKEGNATYPLIDLNAPLFVVSQSRNKLNGVLQSTTAYHYEGAKADLNGRGFLGFHKSKTTTTRIATLPSGSPQTLTEEVETTYRQDFPYVGTAYYVNKKVNGMRVAYQIANMTSSNPYPDVYCVQIKQLDIATFDNKTGAQLSYTVRASSYDAYGNVLTESATTRNAGNTESFVSATSNTYVPADASAWTVDLLKTRQVTGQRTGRTDIVRQWSYDYDADGVLKQEVIEPNVPALKVQTDYGRDSYGNITSVAVSGTGDPAYPDTGIVSRTTNMFYEAGTGYPTGVFKTKDTNALSQSVSRTLDPLTGAVLTETDPNSLTTTLTYDALGRETSRTSPDSVQLTTTREKCASTVAVGSGTTGCEVGEYLKITTTRTGQAASYTFLDGAGREVRKVGRAYDSSNYIISRVEYDQAGRLKRSSKPAFQTVAYSALQWTTNEYDSVGRPTKQTLPGARTTTTAYSGLVTTLTNPKTQTRVETRNALGELVKVQHVNSKPLTYELDALGRITKTIDPKSNQLVFTLDKLGRKTQQQDPDLGTWNYRYNILNQLVWQQDAKGQVTTFTYDKLGRPLTRAEPDLNSSWTWDTASNGIGKLVKLTGDNGFERNYSYDSYGRPSQVITKKSIDPKALASDSDFVHGTSYDSAGRPLTITYPTGFAYQNVYDSNGYLKEVRNKDTQLLYWRAETRDAEGHVTRETLGNGLVTDRKYKVDTGYLDSVLTGTLSGTTLTANVQNDVYSFDGLGNLTSRSQYFGSTSLTEAFGYDSLNRLTTITPVGGTVKSAAYDELGNITSRTETGTYSSTGCGGAHRICSITGATNTSFNYDTNGNQLSGNGRSITWTSYNYPAQFTQGTTTETFLYTPDRDRARRISVENGQTTTTIYLSPRIDLGNSFEKSYAPNNAVSYTHHIYAGGHVVGSVTTSASNAIYAQDFTVQPTTSNSAQTGMTMPSADSYGLIGWDNNTGNGRLAVKTLTTATTTSVATSGLVQYYATNSVLLRAEVALTTNSGINGRSLYLTMENVGATADSKQVGYAAYFRNGTVYAVINLPPLLASIYNLPPRQQVALGAVANNATYVVEMLTRYGSDSVLYVYPKGQSRANGYKHTYGIPWGYDWQTSYRCWRIYANSGPSELANTSYVDNVSVENRVTNRYFHGDHLDSNTAITDEFGNVFERLSYDAWGKRRNTNGTDATGLKGQSTKRGFTLHEHLDSIGLVHMNGRVYDPLVGRFISADPNVFYPDNLQDFNRYSYVHNNPLSSTDPSGFWDRMNEGQMADMAIRDLNMNSLLNRTIDRMVNNQNMLNNQVASSGNYNLIGANHQVKGSSQNVTLQSSSASSNRGRGDSSLCLSGPCSYEDYGLNTYVVGGGSASSGNKLMLTNVDSLDKMRLETSLRGWVGGSIDVNGGDASAFLKAGSVTMTLNSSGWSVDNGLLHVNRGFDDGMQEVGLTAVGTRVTLSGFSRNGFDYAVTVPGVRNKLSKYIDYLPPALADSVNGYLSQTLASGHADPVGSLTNYIVNNGMIGNTVDAVRQNRHALDRTVRGLNDL